MLLDQSFLLLLARRSWKGSHGGGKVSNAFTSLHTRRQLDTYLAVAQQRLGSCYIAAVVLKDTDQRGDLGKTKLSLQVHRSMFEDVKEERERGLTGRQKGNLCVVKLGNDVVGMFGWWKLKTTICVRLQRVSSRSGLLSYIHT